MQMHTLVVGPLTVPPVPATFIPGGGAANPAASNLADRLDRGAGTPVYGREICPLAA